tara:strand:- start:2787 stop:3047 length:261 start_codon:yes stop_codon:yes gene_type:complete
MTNVWILEKRSNQPDIFYKTTREDFTAFTAAEMDFSIWNIENDRHLEADKDETTLTFAEAVEYADQAIGSVHVFNSRKQLNKFRGE